MAFNALIHYSGCQISVGERERAGEGRKGMRRVRERETDRQTETNRQTYRHTDGRAEGRTDRQTDKQRVSPSVCLFV